MTLVICEVEECIYNVMVEREGHCSRDIVVVNEGGRCELMESPPEVS